MMKGGCCEDSTLCDCGLRFYSKSIQLVSRIDRICIDHMMLVKKLCHFAGTGDGPILVTIILGSLMVIVATVLVIGIKVIVMTVPMIGILLIAMTVLMIDITLPFL